MSPIVECDEPLCRPYTTSYFRIERSVEANGIYADIRHFGWRRTTEARFQATSYYLDYSLGPRDPGSLMLRAGVDRAPPGDIVFLPKGADFPTISHPGDHSLLCLTFASERARHLFESEELSTDLAPCFDVRDLHVRQALARLAEEVRAPGFAQEVLVEGIAIALVVDLCRRLIGRGEPTGPASGGLAGWRLRRLKERIEDGIAGPLCVADLAAECGMSVRHLIRTFKATTGATLTDHIASMRIARAKRELRREDRMIKVIAGDCGFQSAAAFSAAFRKATGMTPKQYREEGLRLAS